MSVFGVNDIANIDSNLVTGHFNIYNMIWLYNHCSWPGPYRVSIPTPPHVFDLVPTKQRRISISATGPFLTERKMIHAVSCALFYKQDYSAKSSTQYGLQGFCSDFAKFLWYEQSIIPGVPTTFVFMFLTATITTSWSNLEFILPWRSNQCFNSGGFPRVL